MAGKNNISDAQSTIQEMTARAIKKIEKQGAEFRAQEQAEIDENMRSNAEARKGRLDREAEEKRAKERERERVAKLQRAEEERHLKGAMRERFLAANRSASSEDFERLWPQMRDDHYKHEAATARERQEQAMRASGMYSNIL